MFPCKVGEPPAITMQQDYRLWSQTEQSLRINCLPEVPSSHAHGLNICDTLVNFLAELSE